VSPIDASACTKLPLIQQIGNFMGLAGSEELDRYLLDDMEYELQKTKCYEVESFLDSLQLRY